MSNNLHFIGSNHIISHPCPSNNSSSRSCVLGSTEIKMRFTRILSTLLLLQPTLLFAASHSPNDDTDKPIDEPCTVHSPTTNSYFDLNSINVHTPKDGKKPGKNDRTESWHARGYDYGANFTLNFCGPVMEADSLKNVVGVERAMWKNVSAFYEQHGKTYSLGYV